jgi:hypothetical protein
MGCAQTGLIVNRVHHWAGDSMNAKGYKVTYIYKRGDEVYEDFELFHVDVPPLIPRKGETVLLRPTKEGCHQYLGEVVEVRHNICDTFEDYHYVTVFIRG